MRKPNSDIRIAVTGAGVICSIGRNKAEVWSSIRDGRAGIGKLTRFPGETFPTDMAAEVAMELPLPVPRRLLKRMSRTDVLGVIAAFEAIAQASEVSPLPRERAVVSTGTSTG
ncbi:MAG: beta-ketoacyl synthase N-terminal-like domain-containing protein, partial [Acidobacteriota bacterium]